MLTLGNAARSPLRYAALRSLRDARRCACRYSEIVGSEECLFLGATLRGVSQKNYNDNEDDGEDDAEDDAEDDDSGGGLLRWLVGRRT